jgi:hypothetical protein
VGVVCRPRLIRRDVRLVPQPGLSGLLLGGPGSARGPAGEYGVSALHGGSAPCVWEWFAGLVSSVMTCGWYLDRGLRLGSARGPECDSLKVSESGPARARRGKLEAWVLQGNRSERCNKNAHYLVLMFKLYYSGNNLNLNMSLRLPP